MMVGRLWLLVSNQNYFLKFLPHALVTSRAYESCKASLNMVKKGLCDSNLFLSRLHAT